MKKENDDYQLYDLENSYYYKIHNGKIKVEPILKDEAFLTSLFITIGFNSLYMLSLYTLFKKKLKFLSFFNLFFLTAPTFIFNSLTEKMLSHHIANLKHAKHKKIK